MIARERHPLLGFFHTIFLPVDGKRSFPQSSLAYFSFKKSRLAGEKLFHAVLQPLHREGKHGEDPGNGVIGLGPVLPPGGPLAGVEPDDIGILSPEAVEPIQPSLRGVGVPVGRIGIVSHQLIGSHLSVTHEDDLVLTGDIVQDPLGVLPVLREHGGRGKHPAIGAVVEVVDLQILEVSHLAHRLEQGGAQLGVVVHRAAGVHEQQDLDGILPGPLVAHL